MKQRSRPACFAMAAIAGACMAFFGLTAAAQPAKPSTSSEKPALTEADRLAFIDARIAAIHSGLKLTPEQEKLWPPVETAMRNAGKDAIERWQKIKQEPAGENFIEHLRKHADNAIARGQHLQTIANAAAPLYATLSEEQKRRLPFLVYAIMPHFMHHPGMMGPHQEMMGTHHEHSSMPHDEEDETEDSALDQGPQH